MANITAKDARYVEMLALKSHWMLEVSYEQR